jgi:2-polyprenyl-3-methyl-5-hydroxy-6-metoxy-1,4-benzoquinol methylase
MKDREQTRGLQYIKHRILFYSNFIRNLKFILYRILKKVNHGIALLILVEKKPYSLDKAREYWKYAPSSISSVKKSSEELIKLSDIDIRRFIEKSIQNRNVLHDSNIYRNKVSDWIKRENIKKILDFGCGLGQDGVYFTKTLDIKVDYADIVLSNIKLVSRYSKIWGIKTNGIYISDDPKKFIFPDIYDAIFSNGVLHHTPEAKEIIWNLRKFLKSDGLFICMLYTKKSFQETKSKNINEYAILSESIAPIINPYSDFYTLDKAKKIFKGFNLLESFFNYNERYRWYIFRKKSAGDGI